MGVSKECLRAGAFRVNGPRDLWPLLEGALRVRLDDGGRGGWLVRGSGRLSKFALRNGEKLRHAVGQPRELCDEFREVTAQLDLEVDRVEREIAKRLAGCCEQSKVSQCAFSPIRPSFAQYSRIRRGSRMTLAPLLPSRYTSRVVPHG